MVKQIWQVAQQAVVYRQGFTDCVVYRCSTIFYVAAIPSQTFRRGDSYYLTLTSINNFVEVQFYIVLLYKDFKTSDRNGYEDDRFSSDCDV